MKKQTAEDVENIPVWPINVLVLLISVERNNVYSVRNHIRYNINILMYLRYIPIYLYDNILPVRSIATDQHVIKVRL